MKELLRIDASIFGAKGESSSLSEALTTGLKKVAPNLNIVHRDLSTAPVPHFDAGTIDAIGKGEAALADELIEELRNADTLVIGAPMYNFTVPSQLKAWFDHITRAGVTFKYTPDGPIGLLGKKKVFVIATSGGAYANTPQDAVEPWLRTILGFIGLGEDLHIIRVEGLAQSEKQDQARKQALAQIHQIIDENTAEE